jgi:signal transduction histidine kinase
MAECDAVGLRWMDAEAGFEDALLVRKAAFADAAPGQMVDVAGAEWLRFEGVSRIAELVPAPIWRMTRHLVGPLISQKTAWASVHMHRRESSAPWGSEELASFVAYRSTVALAVENRVMQNLLNREVSALRSLARSAGRWMADETPQEILVGAMELAQELTGFSHAVAFEAFGGGLRPVFARGVSAAEFQALSKSPLLPASHGGLLGALRQGSLSPADLETHPPLADCFPKAVRSLVGLPLTVGGDFEGALILAESRPLGYVSTHLAQAVGPVLAAQAARALRNVVLYRSLAQRTRELERASADLGKAQRQATLVKLAAAVAHQVRNPLSVVSAHVEMMREQDVGDPGRSATLDLLARKVDEVNTTVQQLLELSRPLKLNLKPVLLEQVISDFARFLQPKCRLQGVALELEIAPGIGAVRADATPLQRCLLDLCLNALQALGGAGRLVVAAKTIGEWVCISVSDDGPGISEAMLPVLFEPFATARVGGTGMGLYNVRRICQEMGAVVYAGNLEGGGGRFCLNLRAASAVEDGGPASAEEENHDHE